MSCKKAFLSGPAVSSTAPGGSTRLLKMATIGYKCSKIGFFLLLFSVLIFSFKYPQQHPLALKISFKEQGGKHHHWHKRSTIYFLVNRRCGTNGAGWLGVFEVVRKYCSKMSTEKLLVFSFKAQLHSHSRVKENVVSWPLNHFLSRVNKSWTVLQLFLTRLRNKLRAASVSMAEKARWRHCWEWVVWLRHSQIIANLVCRLPSCDPLFRYDLYWCELRIFMAADVVAHLLDCKLNFGTGVISAQKPFLDFWSTFFSWVVGRVF